MPKAYTGAGEAANYFQGRAPGKVYHASTNAGTPIVVWVGSSATEQFKFYCHGYALDTWATNQYTVDSGYVWNVLEDEYEFLGYEHAGTPQSLQVGDVVVWLLSNTDTGKLVYAKDIASTVTPDLARQDTVPIAGGNGIPAIEHTARISGFTGKFKSLSTIEVGTKNGFLAPARCKLIDLLKYYKGRISYYRPVAQAPRPRLADLFG